MHSMRKLNSIHSYETSNFLYKFMQPATLYTNLCNQQLCIPIYATSNFVYKFMQTATLYTNVCNPYFLYKFMHTARSVAIPMRQHISIPDYAIV